MTLKVIIEDQTYTLPVEDDFLLKAASFFDKMDTDMDRGWQMAREWVESPDSQQKLVIVADKLLTAIENDEKKYRHDDGGLHTVTGTISFKN